VLWKEFEETWKVQLLRAKHYASYSNESLAGHIYCRICVHQGGVHIEPLWQLILSKYGEDFLDKTKPKLISVNQSRPRRRRQPPAFPPVRKPAVASSYQLPLYGNFRLQYGIQMSDGGMILNTTVLPQPVVEVL
jgi:hypothetical protein